MKVYSVKARDGFGNPSEVVYSNGFRVRGLFNENGEPMDVTIEAPDGELVYEGVIKKDIYQYFQTYLERRVKQLDKKDYENKKD